MWTGEMVRRAHWQEWERVFSLFCHLFGFLPFDFVFACSILFSYRCFLIFLLLVIFIVCGFIFGCLDDRPWARAGAPCTNILLALWSVFFGWEQTTAGMYNWAFWIWNVKLRQLCWFFSPMHVLTVDVRVRPWVRLHQLVRFFLTQQLLDTPQMWDSWRFGLRLPPNKAHGSSLWFLDLPSHQSMRNPLCCWVLGFGPCLFRIGIWNSNVFVDQIRPHVAVSRDFLLFYFHASLFTSKCGFYLITVF